MAKEDADKEEKETSPSKEVEENVQEESQMECDKNQAEGKVDDKKEEQDANQDESEDTKQEDGQEKAAEEIKKEEPEKEDEEKDKKQDGFVLLQHLSRRNKQHSMPTPASKSDCEVSITDNGCACVTSNKSHCDIDNATLFR